jgi:NAD(P)-dependent dehydrogenase (short-subunit alcohol dehydrogenase family)
MQALHTFLESLMNLFDPSLEYAFGPTPFYSLSKAALNAGTRTLHSQTPDNVRVLALCPGDISSR